MTTMDIRTPEEVSAMTDQEYALYMQDMAIIMARKIQELILEMFRHDPSPNRSSDMSVKASVAAIGMALGNFVVEIAPQMSPDIYGQNKFHRLIMDKIEEIVSSYMQDLRSKCIDSPLILPDNVRH